MIHPRLSLPAVDLSGVRVVEVGTAISGPLTSVVLASLGASVIKIESRQKLDINRVRIRRRGASANDKLSPVGNDLGQKKRSVAVNLKTPEGRELFLGLLRTSDVFVQNFIPGWLDRLDLQPSVLFETNPRLILYYASGHGQTGPDREQRVFATIMSGLGGLEGLIGYRDGRITGAASTAFGDYNSAHYGALLVLAALFRRHRTGEGCLIDLSQVEAVATMLGEAFVDWQLEGTTPAPSGNRSRVRAPHGIYACLGVDEWVAISVRDDDEWCRFADCVVRNDSSATWAHEAAWLSYAVRLERADELDRLIGAWTCERSKHVIADRLQAFAVTAAPVLNVFEAEADVHLRERRIVQPVLDGGTSVHWLTSLPWHINGDVPVPGPLAEDLGASTVEVCREILGMDAATIEEYQRSGILA